jgi:tRNA threonylcarbamoyladenosine biosynthesis protein TsaE
MRLPKVIDDTHYVSQSPKETKNFGEIVGTLLKPGDVLVLTGDLGAGKTQFTKGVAQGMGVKDEVTSPTFTIEMVYEGTDMPLYHFDLYRLDDEDELEDTGLFDALGTDGPCLIEWGEQFEDAMGDERVDVIFKRLDADTPAGQEPARSIEFVPHGARSTELAFALHARTVSARKED